MKIPYPILSLWLIGSALHAQAPATPPPKSNAAAAIETLHASYQAALDGVNAEREKWLAALDNWYTTNLEKLKVERANAGDLDGALAVKSEAERIASHGAATPEQIVGMPAPLRTLRTTYETSLKKIADEVAQRISPAGRKYLADLEALQKRITMTGDIDQALVVKAEKDRFAAELPGLPQNSPLPPAANPLPATPPPTASTAPAATPPPAKPAPATPPFGKSAAADQADSAVKALIAGSRWQWFDSDDFTGAAHWVEFYRDGTARTSWQTGHTWEILPPNILHFFQPSDKRQWYLDIDVAKKVGVRNPEKDTNHNSMRYEKRVSKPPSTPNKK